MKKIYLLIIVFGFIFKINTVYAQNFKVIMNENNPVSSLTKKEISDFLLKKVVIWPNEQKVIPVDLKSSNKTRLEFTEDVHNKSIAAVKAYWNKQLFSGRNVPPVEKENDQEVISFIKANPGSIGYVSKNANTKGIKVIKILE